MHHSKQIHETHSEFLKKVRGGRMVTSELCKILEYTYIYLFF